jgi:hypothetical protein
MKVLLTHVLVFTLLVAVSVGQGRAATAPQESPKPKKLETLIEEITKLLKASKTPGIVRDFDN